MPPSPGGAATRCLCGRGRRTAPSPRSATGKGKHDQVKHTCEKCGDDSVFCCANKPGEGATKGVEKK
jgi:hypothetical protein